MSKESYVYIMANHTNTTVYIGVTSQLLSRVKEHKDDLTDGFTKRYKTHKLVYYEILGTMNDAIEREKQLKKRKRIKKDELINRMNPTWEDLYEGLL